MTCYAIRVILLIKGTRKDMNILGLKHQQTELGSFEIGVLQYNRRLNTG